MRINIETAELQAFIAVARQSSFRAAAEGLFITQPALSRRIENLEQALQESLFDRTTGASPSPRRANCSWCMPRR
jgi:DNA-binding transcriptional LysR family regulator